MSLYSPAFFRLTLAITFALLFLAAPAAAQAAPIAPPDTLSTPSLRPMACDPDGVQESGAVYRICMPFLWNGDLLVYAHGYVSPERPVGIPEDQMGLPGGPSLPDVANLLGYAFAATSYRTNGLAVLPAIDDLVDLVDIFRSSKGAPDRVLLLGVSEGGVITTLALEQHPAVFDGGLAMCGPYGSFEGQIDYFGDGRTVFDYFFPALLPPSPVDIPQTLMDNWTDVYTNTVRPALLDPANGVLVDQYLAVTGAATDAQDSASKEASIERLLWYNVFATNDATAKLGGQPYGNQGRTYRGSLDDAALNQGIARFAADPAARAAVASYETTGVLSRPLVTLHTTGDPVVPYWHALQYRAKTIAADNIALHEHVRAERYGHCNFNQTEVLAAFNRLRAMVDDPPPYRPASTLYLPAVRNP